MAEVAPRQVAAALEVCPVEIRKVGEGTGQFTRLSITAVGLDHAEVCTWAEAKARDLISRDASVLSHNEFLLGRIRCAHLFNCTTGWEELPVFDPEPLPRAQLRPVPGAGFEPARSSRTGGV